MGSRLRLFVLVLFLFGVPAIVTTALLVKGSGNDVAIGVQPGGLVSGTVRGPSGERLADVRVEIFALSRASERISYGVTRTDSDGAFELRVPGTDGKYEVVAGSGAWQLLVREFGFLDYQGKAHELDPLDLRLEPGCRVAVKVARADGRPIGDGRYELVGRLSGLLRTILHSNWRKVGRFKDGDVVIEALPPMDARLHVQLDSGEKVELGFVLEAGETSHKIEL